MTRNLLMVLFLASSACSASQRAPLGPPLRAAPSGPSQAAQPEGVLLYERYYHEPGAPDPLACKEDAECLGDTVVRVDGCCVPDPTPWPQSLAWHTWLSERRRSEFCKAVQCPPTPDPILPQRCYFEGRCVAGRCQNSCPG